MCEFFDGLFHHPVMKKKNTRNGEWKNKNTCQVVMSNQSIANRVKGMCKPCWTSTQITYGIWWYEWGCGKPRWKTLMISNDAIHVQAEERRKDGKVESIGTLEVDDYLCVVHDAWWCVKLVPMTYKWHNHDKEHANVVMGWIGPWCRYRWLKNNPWLMM